MEPPEGGFVPLSDEVLQEIQTIEATKTSVGRASAIRIRNYW